VNSSVIDVGPALGVVLVLLTASAVATSMVGMLHLGQALVSAAIRAVVQLSLVSLVIAGVITSLPWTLLFLGVMYAVASFTSARRITSDRSGWWAAIPIAAGVIPVLGLVLASGVVPLNGAGMVPTGGILIGGAMTATSLAGLRALQELRSRVGEYEAALSLGFTGRDAALEICRLASTQALVPVLDQTRTVGLVTLPGSFVGVLLGGGTPVEAGAAQVLVLLGLLAAESIAVVVTSELVARGRLGRPSLVSGYL